MTSDCSVVAVKKSRLGGLGLWLPLCLGVFVLVLVTAVPVMSYAAASEGGAIPATPNPAAINSGTASVAVQSGVAAPIGAAPAAATPVVNSPSATAPPTVPTDSSPAPVSTAVTQSNQSNTMLWGALALLFFVLLSLIGIVYKLLENGLETLRRKNATLENTIIQLSQKTNTIKIKQQQPDQPAGAFDQRQSLADRLDLLEEQIRQLKPQPTSAKNGLDPLDDIPMLQSELSMGAPLLSKPLISIDADDRKMFQQAFSEWLSNSLTHQFTDFLSKELLGKINQLGYEIVFAKAGLGLNRMIIDRKPPSKTCMVGLTGANLSLMYCHKKTSQTDDSWRPNSWYEVSIDHPDAADEQTIQQLEELPA